MTKKKKPAKPKAASKKAPVAKKSRKLAKAKKTVARKPVKAKKSAAKKSAVKKSAAKKPVRRAIKKAVKAAPAPVAQKPIQLEDLARSLMVQPAYEQITMEVTHTIEPLEIDLGANERPAQQQQGKLSRDESFERRSQGESSSIEDFSDNFGPGTHGGGGGQPK